MDSLNIFCEEYSKKHLENNFHVWKHISALTMKIVSKKLVTFCKPKSEMYSQDRNRSLERSFSVLNVDVMFRLTKLNLFSYFCPGMGLQRAMAIFYYHAENNHTSEI